MAKWREWSLDGIGHGATMEVGNIWIARWGIHPPHRGPTEGMRAAMTGWLHHHAKQPDLDMAMLECHKLLDERKWGFSLETMEDDYGISICAGKITRWPEDEFKLSDG